MLVKGVVIMVVKIKDRQFPVGLKEFLKESLVQLDHLDQRGLQVLLDLQEMDNQGLWGNLDLLVHLECLGWENQVCQGCQASQEEIVRLDHRVKWVLAVRMDQLDSQGLRVPQDQLGCQG
ncbi:unnamed protein product [Pleuronectes platessa]|uniref:Uncharacterized protein n=1 Tax=Pleuronectes platessa TaxID=8262 RepID=A0A9N7YAZ6_PLEPL|nr:unnamed protein product [Pleuronectes platessa]